jgi:predicted AAA+ superfamily ATPase
MISRRALPEILHSLTEFPAVALLGPRQAGKTTLAKIIAEAHPDALRLDLERPSDLAKLTDPELFLSRQSGHLVVLDEIQHQPELFAVLRALIDAGPIPAARFSLAAAIAPGVRIAGRTHRFP